MHNFTWQHGGHTFTATITIYDTKDTYQLKLYVDGDLRDSSPVIRLSEHMQPTCRASVQINGEQKVVELMAQTRNTWLWSKYNCDIYVDGFSIPEKPIVQ